MGRRRLVDRMTPARSRRSALAYAASVLALAIAAFALGGMAAAAAYEIRPVKREILALYDGAQEGEPDATRIHRFAEMPLNHLGLILRYHDVRDALPGPEEMQRYRGVLTWFVGPVTSSGTYLAWADQAVRLDLHYVILGDLGVDVSPANRPLLDRFLGVLGLRHSGDAVTPTLGTRIIEKDPGLIEFECKLDPVLPGYPIVERIDPRVHVALALEAPAHEGSRRTSLVTVNDKGGYAAFNYEFCHQRPPLHQGRWLIDPFAFFHKAFGAEPFPIPDVTTISGRRLYFSQLNSEGWSNQSQIENYRQSEAIAAEIVLRELIEPFPDLPVTLDLRDSDLAAIPRSTTRARAIAQRMLALPQVERPGQHSVGTTLSRFDARYPSVSSLSALASATRQMVFYSAQGDENAYAGKGERASIGFHSLTQTFDNTETPRRLKGVNLNYHAFAGQHPALLQAVKAHLQAVRASPLAPITTSHYAEIVAGFFSTVIERTGAMTWQVRNRGALQTLRFDDADGLRADLAASIGVIGQTRHAGALYLALDETIEPAIVVLRPAPSPEGPNSGLALLDSRWLVGNLAPSACGLTADAQGYGPGAFTWSGAQHTDYQVTIARKGQVLWQQMAAADGNGVLAFSATADAIAPVTLRIACEPAGER
jgi:hypothetical protein